jgi:hypothetical protein
MLKSVQNLIFSSEYRFQKWAFTKIVIYIFLTLTLQNSYAEEIPDSTKKYDASLSAYPFLYYTPETQLAFGAGGVFTFYSDHDPILNPSNITFSGFYSTIKTYELSIVSNLFFRKNTMASVIDLTYGNIVERFYGVGNNTPDLGNEEFVLQNAGGTPHSINYRPWVAAA